MSDCAIRNGRRRCPPRLRAFMLLVAAVLPALGHSQTVGICDRTQAVRFAIMRAAGASDCAAVNAAQMDGIEELELDGRGIASLRAGDFAGLTGLEELDLYGNELTSLPEGLFNGLPSLSSLNLTNNRLTMLPAGVFSGLSNLFALYLGENQLTTLPLGVFRGLRRLDALLLENNRLTALPAGVFDGLTGLGQLWLNNNQLTTLPPGIFDSLSELYHLDLERNQLASLPPGVFDRLTSLGQLDLRRNRLVGLTRNDPLFARLPGGVWLRLENQTEPPSTSTNTVRVSAAVPLFISASDSMREGFVRIMNFSDSAGTVRIHAYDDAGNPANPVDIPLARYQNLQFNSRDIENGNPAKGIENGIGSPSRGDWRLDIETALSVRVLSYIRTNDGFLTAMHDRMPSGRWSNGNRFMMARMFNPGSNTSQVSKLRLINLGTDAEGVSIEGFDDQVNSSGTVRLTLNAGQSRTLTAQDLENGAQGLTGTLGDGRGKWELYVTARETVIGMSLLESPTGHLSNISTHGVLVRRATTSNAPLARP